jgi:hypothetical protein
MYTIVEIYSTPDLMLPCLSHPNCPRAPNLRLSSNNLHTRLRSLQSGMRMASENPVLTNCRLLVLVNRL